MPEEEVNLVTRSAYNKMKKELSHLENEVRPQIAQKIKEARAEGDLSENGGYQAAKEAQGKNEARIAELTQKLKSTEILKVSNKNNEMAQEGSVVRLKMGEQEVTCLLGSRDLSCVTDKKIISPKSPIGKAVLGKKAGAEVEYEAPGGKKLKVEILSISSLND